MRHWLLRYPSERKFEHIANHSAKSVEDLGAVAQ
jgi:hypothetical protein